MTGIIALGIVIILLLAIAVVFFLKMREKNRRNLYVVLWNLAHEELNAPFDRLNVEAVQHRYAQVKDTIEQLFRLARNEQEFARCKNFEKSLGEWRVHKIQEIYQKRLDRLLKEVQETHNPQRRLELLYQARELAKEAILDDQLLDKIDKWIVYTHIKQVRNKEEGLSLEMKYQLYEEAITKILNSGIEDEKLEAMENFKEFITDFEIMYRRLKK